MLTADLRHALLSAANDAGYPIPGDDPVLRPGGAPGRYTAGLPLRIAAVISQNAVASQETVTGQNAAPSAETGQNAAAAAAATAVAEAIAARLRAAPWIASATPASQGYLVITVTDDALQRLAVRVAKAGPACARSDALRDVSLSPPPVPLPAPPAASPDPWAGARATVLLQVTAALGRAAGASVPDYFINRLPPHPVPSPVTPDPVAAAEVFAGTEAIRYSLARTPPDRLVPPDPAAVARHIEANPAYAVRYAYSCAASTLRWAAALGLSPGEAAGFRPDSLAHPRERALLDALSWLPEQVARAARRGRPHEFTAYLEGFAETYQVCRVACPAWPERGDVVRARLWLTGAAAAGLAAGLDLLGVSAPARL